VGVAGSGLPKALGAFVAGQRLLTTRTAAGGPGRTFGGGRLSRQPFGQHLLGEDLAQVAAKVFAGGPFGPPRRAVRPVQLRDEVVGDACDRGANFFDRGRAFLGAGPNGFRKGRGEKRQANFLMSS
jgi:hypothetical protein